jgi:hypothetical protein
MASSKTAAKSATSLRRFHTYSRWMGVVVYTVRQSTLDGEIVGTYRHPGTYEPALDDVIVVGHRQWRVADLLSVEPSQDPDYNTLVVEAADNGAESD